MSPPGRGHVPEAGRARRRLVRAAALAAVALGAGAGAVYLVAREPGPPSAAGPPRHIQVAPKPRSAGPAERALVAPLREGAALDDFEVKAIHAVSEEGVLRVVCARGKAVVRLDVALASDEGPAPAAAAGDYAIFYSLKNATPEEGERLAGQLAGVLKSNAGVVRPPGMAPFTPKPRGSPPI